LGKSKARVMMKKLKEKIKAFDSASVEQVKIIIHYKYPNLSFYFDKAVKSNLIRTAYCYIYSRRRRHWVEAVVNTDKNELYWITCCELHKDYFEKLSKELDLKFIDLSEIEIEDQFTEKVKIENIDSVHAKAAYFFIKNGPTPTENSLKAMEENGAGTQKHGSSMIRSKQKNASQSY